MAHQTESRKALHELIELLQEVDKRWVSEEWNLGSEADEIAAHRALMHMLEGGLVGMFESDPTVPEFRRIVTPSRKFTGDNSDAIYFDAPVSPEHEYRVNGNMGGAVYVSITVEAGTQGGGMASRSAGVLNNTDFDVDADGNFELYLGGAPRERNWLNLEKDASRITTRHYFEEPVCAAADARRAPDMHIERLGEAPPPAPPNDDSVAAGIRRVAEFVRTRTLLQPPMAQRPQMPSFVGLTPNEFPEPQVPGDMGLAAFDAMYSMAPYLLGPDEALVATGHWPECLFGNVCLWNRFQQTLDYANRQVSLNRKQTQLEKDGSFRIIFAHQDPGQPNWIDTEGHPFGLVFWRFFLVKGEAETPQAQVVPFSSL